MRVPLNKFPKDIQEYYNFQDIATNDGYIFIKIKKAMYGLKQAAVLAYQLIKNTLEPHGYYPVIGTTGMWKHKTRNISYCLCVNNFGVKYFDNADVNHLLDKIVTIYNYTLIGKVKIIVVLN